MTSPEADDAIYRAEEIVEEDPKDDIVFSIALPSDTSRFIVDRLKSALALEEAFIEVIHRSLNVPGISTHPESTINILIGRFTNELEKDTEPDEDQVQRVTIDLSGRELDFINGEIKPKKKTEEEMRKWEGKWRRDTRKAFGIPEDAPPGEPMFSEEEYRESEEWWKKINFEAEQENTSAFLEINLAFVKAGGSPRHRLTEVYEGPLPTPDGKD